MREYLRNSDVRAAIDDCLSGVESVPSQRAEILRRAMDRPRGRRKISATLALAMLLALLAVGALAAAWLSAREIVEQRVVPMAIENDGEEIEDTFTNAELAQVVALAEENGVEVPEKLRELLARGEGYWEEETIMALAKAEFGSDLSAWTLEQQNWFDDMCVAIGFLPQKQKAMPEQGENAKEWAIALANAYIHETYNPYVDLHDTDVYPSIGCQYINGDADGEYSGRYWSIDYRRSESEASLRAAEYWVYISDDGEFLGSVERLGAVPGATSGEITGSFERAYGDRWDWTQEQLRAYQEAMLQCREQGFERQKRYMELTEYPNVPENAIEKEEAMCIAQEETGADMTQMTALLIGDEPNPVWKVYVDGGDDIALEIDCMTGEVKNVQTPARRRSMQHVLQRVVEQVDAEEEAWIEANSFG